MGIRSAIRVVAISADMSLIINDHSVKETFSLQMETSARVNHKSSHLPLLRFTSIVTVFVALDCLICISLWIAGGDSLYMEDSVIEFSFTHSTFDLACIAFLRCIVLVICFYYLEHYSLLKSSRDYDKQKVGNQVVIFCQVGIFILSASSVMYGSIKGALILKSVLQGTWNNVEQQLHMHITYKVLCIASIVFPGIELVFGIVSSWCIRRMIRVKRLHLIVNMEEDDNLTQVKKKADIKRIILLAKPVGSVCKMSLLITLLFYCTGISFDSFWHCMLGYLFHLSFSSSFPFWESY